MRIVYRTAVATSALVAAGCSGSAHNTSPTTTNPPTPNVAYAVPAHARGEIAREVFPGLHGSVFGESEALPRPSAAYMLTIACVGKASTTTVAYQVLDAGAGHRPSSPEGRTVLSGSTTCHGGAGQLIGLPALPHHPVQVSMTWNGGAVTKAYAVIAP